MTSTPDEVAYCTRETVHATLDQTNAVRLNSRVDAGCRAGALALEGACHRRFYPTYGTRYPEWSRISGDTLWLNHIDLELISVETLTVDGTVWVEGTDFYLSPDRPPYTAIRRIRDAAAGWPTTQRDIVIVGFFGGSANSAPAGALAAAITTAAATVMTVTDSAAVGVGDLVLIDTERVIVTEKRSATTTATVTATVDADEAVTTIPVSSGALVNAGEMILIGSERMFVEDVAGNNLVVQRAQQSSVLAAHANLDVVYAPRLCSITRGAAGTTAATHLTAAALTRNVAPSLVAEASAAVAIDFVEQGKAAYGRTAGAGDHRRSTGGTGVAAAIAAAVERASEAYGRRGRIGVC